MGCVQGVPGTSSREDGNALEEGSLEQGSENRGLRKARGKVSWVGRPEQAHGWKMKVMMGVQGMY